MEEAYISLATNNDNGNGAYLLGKSLRISKTSKQMILMVTEGVSEFQRQQLMEVWDQLVHVSDDGTEQRVQLERPELGCSLSKLRAWTLTQYKKCVFIDPATLVIQNVDDLFEREELSAAPDIAWPDCFSTAVFVFRPSKETHQKLLEHAHKHGSFDGSDHGILNEYFADWSTKDIGRHLPFTYNTTSSSVYSYVPAFNRYGKDVKIVNFSGPVKPWHHHFDKATGQVVPNSSTQLSMSHMMFTKMWWDLYNADISGEELKGLTTWEHWNNAKMHAEKRSADRKSDWERGTPDYHGEDRFDNILTYMSAMMLQSQPTKTPDASSGSDKSGSGKS